MLRYDDDTLVLDHVSCSPCTHDAGRTSLAPHWRARAVGGGVLAGTRVRLPAGDRAPYRPNGTRADAYPGTAFLGSTARVSLLHALRRSPRHSPRVRALFASRFVFDDDYANTRSATTVLSSPNPGRRERRRRGPPPRGKSRPLHARTTRMLCTEEES